MSETFGPNEPSLDDWRDTALALEAENATLTDRCESLTQELALCRDTLRLRTLAHGRLVADRLACPTCSTKEPL